VVQKALGGYDHLLVLVDKFTKWIEAKQVTQIRSDDAVGFFLDIIYRFEVPNCIITDNGTQFTGTKFLCFCDAMITTFGSIGPRFHSPRPTGRSSALTTWSCRA
jgi:hypothetical protein